MILSDFKERKTLCGYYYRYKENEDLRGLTSKKIKALRIKGKKFRNTINEEGYPIDIIKRLFVVAMRYKATHVGIFEHDADNVIQDKVTVIFYVNHTAPSQLH